MKQGFSGFCVLKEGDKVIKWTQGSESYPKLKFSYQKQLEEIINQKLTYLKAVPIIAVTSKENLFSFTMPFINGKTGYETDRPLLFIHKIEKHFKCRLERMEIGYGFKEICNTELNRLINILDAKKINAEKQINIIKAQINNVADYYPKGYCHGDLGLANLIHYAEKVFVIDFENSFIDSPLVDLVTYGLSITLTDKKIIIQRDSFDRILNFHYIWIQHYKIIRNLKLLSYVPFQSTENDRKEKLGLIND